MFRPSSELLAEAEAFVRRNNALAKLGKAQKITWVGLDKDGLKWLGYGDFATTIKLIYPEAELSKKGQE